MKSSRLSPGAPTLGSGRSNLTPHEARPTHSSGLGAVKTAQRHNRVPVGFMRFLKRHMVFGCAVLKNDDASPTELLSRESNACAANGKARRPTDQGEGRDSQQFRGRTKRMRRSRRNRQLRLGQPRAGEGDSGRSP